MIDALYPKAGKVASRVTNDMLFFLKPEMNNGQERRHEVFVDCKNPLALNDKAEIEFFVMGNSDFISLADTELHMEVRVKKKSGFALNPGVRSRVEGESSENVNVFPDSFLIPEVNEDDDPAFHAPEFITPIDGFLHTQWKNIVCKLGSGADATFITNTNNDQPYRSYLDIFLRTPDEDRDLAAYKWLYTRGSGKERRDNPNPFTSGDEGAQARFKRVRSGNIVQLAGKLHTDFLKDPKLLLLNGVNFYLKLSPADNKFRFKVSPPELEDMFDYEILDIKLKICYVTLSKNTLEGIDRVLLKSPVYYEYVKTDLRVFPIHAGQSRWNWPNIWGPNVPLDIIFVMVDDDAFNGNYRKDPFFFKREHLITAAFTLYNTSIPAKPLDFSRMGDSFDPVEDNDYTSKREDEWSMRALESLWSITGGSKFGMNYRNYVDGAFAVGINTDPTVPANVEYWGVPKTGPTDLQLTFSKPLPVETQLLVLARFPALLTIDHKREVKMW